MYISLEGPEGCGKSVLSKALSDNLKAHWTCEPSNQSEITSLLRKITLDKTYSAELNPTAREYLMLASRSISLTDIKTRYQSSKQHIVSDRCFLSGMVYAKAAADFAFEEWWSLAKRAITILPDVIVYLEVDKIKIEKRENDIYDNAPEAFHKTLRDTYNEAVEWWNWYSAKPRIFVFKNNFDASIEKNISNLKKLINIS